MRNSEQVRLSSGRTISKNALFAALNIGGWSLLALVVGAWEAATWGIGPAALMDLLYGLGGILICYPLRWLYRQGRRAQRSYVVRGITAAVICALVSPIWWTVDHFLDVQVFSLVTHWGTPTPMFQRLLKVFLEDSYWVSPIGWLINALSLFSWSVLYLGVNAVLDLEMERARAEQASKLADSARLRALQSQLKPHFLFNTLNGISTLIREGEGAAAASIIATLSDFLRMTLETQDAPEITVAAEMVFIDRYLRIQTLRFGSRLHTSIDVAPEALRARIPTLILQPLVENAVRHGILSREQGGSVAISVRRSADTLVASVEDDGDGLPAGQLQFGVGLRNTEERLAALYGDAAHLHIGASSRGGFSVRITLPFVADVPEGGAANAPLVGASAVIA